MADTYAKRTYVGSKRGRGKVVLSEGVAPAEKILPDVGLATLLKGADDQTIANHFEVIMLKGTIITAYEKTYDSGETGLVAAPCAGRSGCELVQVLLDTVTGVVTYDAPATAAAGDQVDLGLKLVEKGLRAGANAAAKTAGATAKPLGVLTQDALRPFAYGENEGVSWITHGYIEWPLVKKAALNGAQADTTVFDNTGLVVGDYIKPDALGRPVKFVEGVDPEFLRIGRVVAKDIINADYDFGLLNYFTLPQSSDMLDHDIIEKAYTINKIDPANNTVTQVFGLRPNVDGVLTMIDPATTVAGATGAVRVQLINL